MARERSEVQTDIKAANRNALLPAVAEALSERGIEAPTQRQAIGQDTLGQLRRKGGDLAPLPGLDALPADEPSRKYVRGLVAEKAKGAGNGQAKRARRRGKGASSITWDASDEPDPREWLSENAMAVLQRRYLAKDREGEVVEEPKGMFLRVARTIAAVEATYNPKADLDEWTRTFYRLMANLEFVPNSPTLMNAGRELGQLSACFVLPVGDSIADIFDAVKYTAQIHKSGGGTGFAFSRLRPEGDVVGSTGGIASGPVSFMKIFDAATEQVKQGGTRRGANMGILKVTHPDILRFIHMKEDGKTLQNFNISVAVTEEFMRAAEEGRDYDLVNPRGGKVTGQLNARDVFRQIVEAAWRTGDPGLVFLDRINAENPTPLLGEIESTNPCGEQPLLPYESCNLGSINLNAVLRPAATGGSEIDWEKLDRLVRLSVRFLDNVIDANHYPIPQIDEMSKMTRRIGLGVMGWADILVRLGTPYNSEEALELGERLMTFLQDVSLDASRDLAEERGAFPAYKGSRYDVPGARPMRNSAPTTIAPTGTISIIANCSSGIEPLFALSYVRNVMDRTRLVEVNPWFEPVAKERGFYSPELMERLAEVGSCHGMAEVPEDIQRVFVTSHDITPDWHVRMQAAFQRHTDNAVSKTINFSNEASIQDVETAYILAYRLRCKGITIYRDGSKTEQVLSTGKTAKVSEPATEERVVLSHAALLTPRERPRELQGVTERVRTGHGNMYVNVTFDEKGRPFEVFSTLGKAGGCDAAELEAVSRLVSLALRSGIDPVQVVEQLSGITCAHPRWDEGVLVRSVPDAVALALRRYVGGHTPEAPAPEKPEHFEPRPREEHPREPEAVQAPFPGITPVPARPHLNGNGHKAFSSIEALGVRGAQCPDCPGVLEFVEGCMLCRSCGYSQC
ncbi:MAG: vitamin B12-dependent ribonucleotide reductase [Chloroflexi bacterium]|nr:vitamin B12-dependent ribonucleotide reductase [Chloroflexota bacterium]